MKRFSQACLLVFLVALSLSCPAAMKRLTHSFHVARLFVTLLQEPCPKWTGFNSLYDESVNVSSLEKVRQVLSQDFDYLGRGSQAFVFASRDGSAVLKLFIFDSVDSFIHRFFHSLFRMSFNSSYSNRVQKRAVQTLEACRLADQFLQDDTAILYVHLIPKQPQGDPYLPTVRLSGPAWKRMNIRLDAFRFVLQKRADLLSQSLMQAYLLHDQKRFFNLIDQLNALLNRRIRCGIMNTDPTLFENFGVIGGRPVEIDFGNFVYCPEIIDQKRSQEEKARYTDQLIKWVERSVPQWKDDVALRIKENQ